MLNELIDEYDRMYRENPVRWDLVTLDQTRFEILQPYSAPGDRVLDIGCGSGHTLEYFAERFPLSEFYGIDLSPVAVNIARTNVPRADIRAQALGDCDLREMDIIILGGVAEHFTNLGEGLAQVRRMLSKIGIVYLEVPNCISYQDAHGEGFYKTRADGQTEWHMTRPRWEEVIIDSGFEIVKSVKGPKAYNEFIWILSNPEE